MEFDEAGGRKYETDYMLIERKFAEAGYSLPGNSLVCLIKLEIKIHSHICILFFSVHGYRISQLRRTGSPYVHVSAEENIRRSLQV